MERYVLETSSEKMNLILINKADFLSEKQRQAWAEYFDAINLPVAFFSALQENQNHQLRSMAIQEEGEEEEAEEQSSDDEDYEDCDDEEEIEEVDKESEVEVVAEKEELENCKLELEKQPSANPASQGKNSTQLRSRDELIELLKTIHKGSKVQGNRTVVGLVGYPNVGKSSTLNSLLTYKKVSVSATPGKTKHFQVRYFNFHT